MPTLPNCDKLSNAPTPAGAFAARGVMWWLDEKPPTTERQLNEAAFFDGLPVADAQPLREVESNVGGGKTSAGINHRTSAEPDWRLIPSADAVETTYRHGTWKARRQMVFAAMGNAGYSPERIERFINCGAAARVVENARSGEFKTRSFLCHDRWCERCAQAKTLLIGDNLVHQLEGSDVAGLHIVLTNKHKRIPLADQVTKCFRDFKTLREKAIWKNAVAGAAYFLQTHVASSDGLWHVHLHIIAECRRLGGHPAWLDAMSLSLWWKQITGDSDNVHVSRIYDAVGVAREVCRYAAKPADGNTTDDPDKLAEMMRALGGRRLCSTVGTWRSFRLCEKPPIDASEIWLDHGMLTDLVWRARRGEDHANRILDLLWKRTIPKNGPPMLWDPRLVDEE